MRVRSEIKEVPSKYALTEWLRSGIRAIWYNEDILLMEYLSFAKHFQGAITLNEWRKMDIEYHLKLISAGQEIIDRGTNG